MAVLGGRRLEWPREVYSDVLETIVMGCKWEFDVGPRALTGSSGLSGDGSVFSRSSLFEDDVYFAGLWRVVQIMCLSISAFYAAVFLLAVPDFGGSIRVGIYIATYALVVALLLGLEALAARWLLKVESQLALERTDRKASAAVRLAQIVTNPHLAIISFAAFNMAFQSVLHFAFGCGFFLLGTVALWPLIVGALVGGRGLLVSLVVNWTVLLTAPFFSAVYCDPGTQFSSPFAFLFETANEPSAIFLAFLYVRILESHIRSVESRIQEVTSMWLRDVRTPFHGLLGCLDEYFDYAVGDGEGKFCADDDAKTALSPESTMLGCSLALESIFDNVARSAPLDMQTVVSSTRRQSLNQTRSRCLVPDLIKRIRPLLEATLERKSQTGNKVEWEGDRAFSHFELQGAFDDLLQIVLNLISNAAKFSPVGGKVNVSLCTRRVSAPNIELVCRVVDNGPGVPVVDRENIFQPFVRRKRGNKAGFGLGLTLVREFATRLGGEVKCTDRSDGCPGAAFVMKIPAIHSPGDQLGPTIDAVFDPVQMTPVVIVDDSDLNLRILQRLLIKAGIPPEDIVCFGSAEQALSGLESSFPWKLAILDLELPGMNGIELTRELLGRAYSARNRRVVVAASAALTEKTMTSWSEAGADIPMPKPFKCDDLHAVLAEAFSLMVVQPARGPDQGPPPSPVPHATDSRRELGVSVTRFLATLILFSSCLAFVGYLIAGYTQFALFLVPVAGISCVVASPSFLQAYEHWWLSSMLPERNLMPAVLCVSISLAALLNDCQTMGNLMLPAVVGGTRGWAHVCVAVSIMISSLRYVDAPVCVDVMGIDAKSALILACLVSGVQGLFFLRHLADGARAFSTKKMWLRTLSHDIRTPLEGILVCAPKIGSISVEQHGALARIRSCADVLTATASTFLILSELPDNCTSNSGRQQTFYLREVLDFALQHIRVLFDDGLVDTRALRELAQEHPNTTIRLPGSPFLFVLSRFLARLSMQRSDVGTLIVSVCMEESHLCFVAGEILTDHADNAEPAPPADSSLAPNFNCDTAFWWTLHDVLHGTMRLDCRTDELCGRQIIWRLRLEVPAVVVTGSSSTPPSVEEDPWQQFECVIADDSDLHHRILSRQLARLNVTKCASFYTRRELEATVPREGALSTVFFLDLNMPGVTNPADWKDLIDSCAGKPHRFVAFTADESTRTARECHRAGFHDFLPKPVSALMLQQCLQRVCDIAETSAMAEHSLGKKLK